MGEIVEAEGNFQLGGATIYLINKEELRLNVKVFESLGSVLFFLPSCLVGASKQGDVMSPDGLEAVAACWSGSTPSLHVNLPETGGVCNPMRCCMRAGSISPSPCDPQSSSETWPGLR